MRVRVSLAVSAFAFLGGCMLPRPPADPAPYVTNCIDPAPPPARSYLFVTTRLPDCRREQRSLTPFRANVLSFGAWTPFGIHFYDAARWKQQVRARIEPPALAPVLYIHGFNNSNLAAITRAAAIRHATGREVIVLTWPSYDKTVKYFWDEANMAWSMPQARAIFRELTAIRPDLTIIAHSMGNHLAIDMVRSWKAEHPNRPMPIRQLIMAAPDVDREWFITSAGPDLGVSVTLYASTRDQPLSASWRSHGYARAGDLSKWVTGTENAYPYAGREWITVVDTSPVSGGIGHADFIETHEGAADLCRVVNSPDASPELGRQKVAGQANSWSLVAEPDLTDPCSAAGKAGADIATGRWRRRSGT